jgi:hypothetical protein
MSFLLIAIAALGVLLILTGAITAIVSKPYRIVGIVFLSIGCLLALGALGTFGFIVSRMG